MEVNYDSEHQQEIGEPDGRIIRRVAPFKLGGLKMSKSETKTPKFAWGIYHMKLDCLIDHGFATTKKTMSVRARESARFYLNKGYVSDDITIVCCRTMSDRVYAHRVCVKNKAEWDARRIAIAHKMAIPSSDYTSL